MKVAGRITAFALLAAALATVSCSTRSGLQARLAKQPSVAKKPKGPTNHFVAFRGSKKNTGATLRTERLLYPPFEWTATLGYFDPSSALLPAGTSFGLSMSDPAFVGAYAAVAMRTVGGVPEVFATMNPSGGPAPNLTTLPVPGGIAEVQVQHTGTQFVVSARARGDANWTELGRGNALVARYEPSMDVGTLPKDVVVGFDDLQVQFTGRPPGETAVEALNEDVYRAYDDLAFALTAADGPEPDTSRALGHLGGARTTLEFRADSPDLPATSRKKVQAALKKVDAAIDTLTNSLDRARYFDAVFKAASATAKAAASIR